MYTLQLFLALNFLKLPTVIRRSYFLVQKTVCPQFLFFKFKFRSSQIIERTYPRVEKCFERCVSKRVKICCSYLTFISFQIQFGICLVTVFFFNQFFQLRKQIKTGFVKALGVVTKLGCFIVKLSISIVTKRPLFELSRQVQLRKKTIFLRLLLFSFPYCSPNETLLVTKKLEEFFSVYWKLGIS